MIIKPCPHCGGESYLHSSYSYKTKGYFVYVKCDVCGAQGKIYLDEEEPSLYSWETPACQSAVAAWNMRTGEDAKPKNAPKSAQTDEGA